MSIKNKVVLVSGASAGIGQAVSARLLNAGATVIACGRNEEKLHRFAERCTGATGELQLAPGDVTDSAYLETLFHQGEKRINTFVLCAGQGLPGTLLTSDNSKWHALFQLNCLAAMEQLRIAAECFVAQEKSDQPVEVQDLVVIGSTVGREISASNPVYGATKFALHSLVESLRQELCVFNIRVTLIEPGFVHSEFQQNANYDMAWFNSLERKMGPFLQADDVARTIEFVIAQPPAVHLDNIRIRPTHQKA
ncbi:hypothetical protein BTO01_29135 [Vibrio jasicida]|uniref:SDR family oxidoreductase n=1 Tax=Vibrio jasicida TaxID=766224 RepID=UPI000CF4F5CB|nr:SDR family oxidoreductase [Vibrio jasicida]PQJ44591.1 hypothetical protein BTO01_29135 [Vibrio jasicida]